jgi:ankyrin repeat protein
MPKDEISSKLLSVKGVAVNISTQSGDTPLHLALTERSTAALIRLGAKVNVRNNAGESPLMCACKRGVLPVVDLLLRAGADPLMPDGEGATALHAAAGNVECLKLLLDAKPSDLNIKITGTASERQGMTPLHVAIAVACQDSALALLDAGADATITLKDQVRFVLTAINTATMLILPQTAALGVGLLGLDAGSCKETCCPRDWFQQPESTSHRMRGSSTRDREVATGRRSRSCNNIR